MLLLIVVSASAQARPEIGSRIDRQPDAPTGSYKNTPQDLTRLANRFSKCFARDHPKLAKAVMELPLFSEEQNSLLKRSLDAYTRCLDDTENVISMTIKDPRLLIPGLAEGLYLYENAGQDAAALVASRKVQPRNGDEDLALCLVHRNPARSRTLIDTLPGSNAEADAVKQLVPDLGPCVPNGLTLKLNKVTVRTYAAAGLYLVATLPQQAAP